MKALAIFSLLLCCCISVSVTQQLQYDNVALKWMQLYLDLLRTTRTVGPTNLAFKSQAAARAFSILGTSLYDAWAPYNHHAIAVHNDVVKRVSGSGNTIENIEKSVSFSAYRTTSWVFGTLDPLIQQQIDDFFAGLGYDKFDNSTVWFKNPAGLGNFVASTIINFYSDDGTNYDGSHPNADGKPYSDYTGWKAVNDPFPQIGKTDCSKLRAIDRWQPARFRTATGSAVQELSDTNFQVKYFEKILVPMNSFLAQFPAPPKNGTRSQPDWDSNVEQSVLHSSMIDDNTKAIAQYWQTRPDGPFAYIVRIGLDAAVLGLLHLEDSIKLAFGLAHTIESAQQFVNDGKKFWDSARPTTLVQCKYANQQIYAWKGPYQGVGYLSGSNWTAYLPDFNPQITTPEYPCGHCALGSAFTKFFRTFFGSDTFLGFNQTFLAGSFPQEPKIVAGQPGYQAGVTDVPNSGPTTVGYAPATDITLSWSKWSEMGVQIGFSRLFLGVHFESSRALSTPAGEQIADLVWDKLSSLWD